MITLSATLEAAQQSPSARPYVRLRLLDRDLGVVRLRWDRWYDGTEPDGPARCAVLDDGTLIRARIDPATGNLYTSRITSPTAAADFTSWTLLAAVSTSALLALDARGSRVLIATLRADGAALLLYESDDAGATFGTVTTITGVAGVTAVAAALHHNVSDGSATLLHASAGVVYTHTRAALGAFGAPDPWTQSLATVTGLDAHSQTDVEVLVSGTDAAGNSGCYATSVGIGQALPAGFWLALRDLALANPQTSVTYQAVSWELAGVVRATLVERYSGIGAYDRTQLAHVVPGANFADQEFREPRPFAHESPYGLGLGAQDPDAYLVSSDGVWHASTTTTVTDLTDRLLSADLQEEEGAGGRLVLELDNADGALNPAPPGEPVADAITATLLDTYAQSTVNELPPQRVFSVSTGAKLLVVCFHSKPPEALQGVSYGGQPLTQRARIGSGGSFADRAVEVWTLTNPPTGSNTLIPDSANGQMSGYALVSFELAGGVDTADPIGAVSTAEEQAGLSDTPSVQLTTEAAHSLVLAAIAQADVQTPYTDQSNPAAATLYQGDTGGSGGDTAHAVLVVADAGDAGSKTLAAQGQSLEQWAIAAVEVRATFTTPGGGPSTPPPAPGLELAFDPGFTTSAGDEYAPGRAYWVTATRRYRDARGRGVLEVEAVDAIRRLFAWRAPRQLEYPGGAATGAASLVLEDIARRAGLPMATINASQASSDYQPAYTVRAGEAGATAIGRLLGRLPDQLHALSAQLRLEEPDPAALATYTYGIEHGIFECAVEERPRPFGRVRVFGDVTAGVETILHFPVVAEAFDPDDLAAGAPTRIAVDANIDDATDAQTRADTLLARAARERVTAGILVPVNVGQEVGDVVEVTDATLGLSAARYRVRALRLRFARGHGKPRYDLALQLGEV